MAELKKVINSEEFTETTMKSIKTLQHHSKKTNDPNLYLIINTNKPLLSKKDYVQRIVPVPHKYESFEDKRIMIITPPHTPLNNYTDLLRPLTNKYDNIELVSIKKLKKFNESKKKELSKDFDLILADYRIHKLLPEILGGRFYIKNKKIPYIIKLSNPKTFDTKSTKDEIDIKFIKAQIKSIMNNVSFLLSTDSNITFKIYNFNSEKSHLKSKDILANIIQIIKFLTSSQNKQVTNWNDRKFHVTSIHLKTNESASLPIFTIKGDNNGDDGEEN